MIVRITGDASSGRTAGYAGLSTCGSVWACPVCSERIQAKRRDELAALCAVAESRACTVLLTTLTMRHRRGDSLAELWDDLSAAWNAVTTNHAWRRAQGAYGYHGCVKAVEVTVGPHGWHVHIHALMIIEWHHGETEDAAMTDEEARSFGEMLWGPWAAYLSDRPGRAPVRDAFDVRVGRGALDRMGEYLAKQGTYRQSFEGLAAEATFSAHKVGRGANRTPFQVLADIVGATSTLRRGGDEHLTGRDDDEALRANLALWGEWERASRGRRQLEWSRKTKTRPSLREWAGLGEEQTDEEAAAEELGGDDAVILPAETWRSVRTRPWVPLEVAEAGGTAALVAWLEAAGLDYVRCGTEDVENGP